jgi:type IV pilus assembly protein PilA
LESTIAHQIFAGYYFTAVSLYWQANCNKAQAKEKKACRNAREEVKARVSERSDNNLIINQMERRRLMLTKIRKKLNKKGFTLIELMIVIAIIGILAAIAIPQFAAYRAKSYNSAAQSDLRNVLTVLEAYYADYQKYPSGG